MQDFYILQRTDKPLNAEVIQRWYLTVDMLAPEDVIMSDDETNSFVMATQDDSYFVLNTFSKTSYRQRGRSNS